MATTTSGVLTYQRARIPGGYLTVVVDPDSDCVVYATFREPGPQVAEQPQRFRKATNPVISEALQAYGDGDCTRIDAVKVTQSGTDFRQRAWWVMRQVPAGEVITYAMLAERIGNPGAARAAGTACATNQIPLFVPCHRIVATQGLGGYAFGLPVKERLLHHEGWSAQSARSVQSAS